MEAAGGRADVRFRSLACSMGMRIFSGEIGYPGSIQVETFPYLEVVDVK